MCAVSDIALQLPRRTLRRRCLLWSPADLLNAQRYMPTIQGAYHERWLSCIPF